MEFKKLTSRFRQFGGLRLVREYAKLGVLGIGVKAFFRCLVKRESFKGIYPEILKKVEPFLEQKYAPVVQEFKKSSSSSRFEHKRNKVVWFCWLQGMEDAPDIVRVCYHSLTRLTTYRLQVIDGKNWRQFVELPEYVVRKWEKGRIPAANFSDLLRLELLIKYGGTWIDSTVLCTGGSGLMVQGCPSGESAHARDNSSKFGSPLAQSQTSSFKFLDADLFLFQYTPEGTTRGISISNWFITSCTNNEVLMAVRDMLYAYWKDFDCTLDYYMFHPFFEIVAREYPEQVGKMPYGSSQRSIALMRHWNEPFNQEQWDKLVSKVAFHKLSHRVSEELKNNKGNYYNYIVKFNGSCVPLVASDQRSSERLRVKDSITVKG